MSFKERKTFCISSLLRNAGFAAAAACLAFSTASAEERIKAVPTAVIFQQSGEIKVIMHEELADGQRLPIEDYYRTEKGWDFNKLRETQIAYYKAAKVYHPANSTNGIPNQILDLLPIITEVAKNYDLNPKLIVSIIKAESFGYRYAIGPKEELGLMQINIHDPSLRLSKWQYENIFDPEVNISIGASILKSCMAKSKGNTIKAIEAYNSGMSGIVPKSTKNYYVGAVIGCMHEMDGLYNP